MTTHMPDTGQVVVATRQTGSGLTAAQRKLLALIVNTTDKYANPQGVMVHGHEMRSGRILAECGYIAWCDHRAAKPLEAGRAALAASEAHDAGGNDG